MSNFCTGARKRCPRAKRKGRYRHHALYQVCIDAGADELVIVGGIGGRLDTRLPICNLCYAESHGVHAVQKDGRNEARVISGHIRIPKKPGFYLSVFAYGGECRGVSEIGVRYPLRDAVLSVNFPLGVSNEIVDDCAEIEVREGRLLVILSGKEREEAEA